MEGDHPSGPLTPRLQLPSPPSHGWAYLYARAEAKLGWLNATVVIEGERPFDANVFLDAVVKSIRSGVSGQGGEIAHLKLWVSTGRSGARVSLVSTSAAPDWDARLPKGVRTVEVTVNVRAALAPEILEELVKGAFADECGQRELNWTLKEMQAFRPAPPKPTYRINRDAK